jgi:hypothetical protein
VDPRPALLIERHHAPHEAALFVLSLVEAARRALLLAEGCDIGRALVRERARAAA